MKFRPHLTAFSVIACCVALLVIAGCQANPASEAAPVRRNAPLLPLPALVEAREGTFTLNADTPILVPADNAEAQRIGELLSGYVQRTRGVRLAVGAGPVGTADRSPAPRLTNWKYRPSASVSRPARRRVCTTAR